MKMAKILIVDDEIDIAELISDSLTDEGFETLTCNKALDALNLIDESIDLILLDIMMPNMTGIELCNKIREKIKCPIIFVTAKASTVDKLVGFEIGADDYITKPFDIYELVARVKAHLRREERKTFIDNKKVIIGEFEINKESYDVFKCNERINVSTREFEVLWYLVSNAGVVLTKEQIFHSVWGNDYGDIGTVAVHIKSLRDKLDEDEKYIKTIWGVGYKFLKEVRNDS
jgi:DNA-binding response OmpR family regulator